jgi:glycine/D-amino acid oxidase-like deaminating enzyme
MRRRELLAAAGAAFALSALQGCAVGVRDAARPRPAAKMVFPRLRASTDRITRITVCTRPFRAQGPRLDVEQIGQKSVVHNYGHGGSGWSLSWGSSGIAVQKAMATGERNIAVIGCGALGLTSALLLQRAGAQVTMYAKELPPDVRSSLATGLWTPDSRICFEQYATPSFKQTWQHMARNSFQTYQTMLGLPGTPVEFIDSFTVSDNADTARHHDSASDERPKFAELQRELINDLIPESEEFAPGSHPFDQRYMRRNTLMMFNLTSYSRMLMSDFIANGGKIEIVEFHTPADLAAIRQKTLINATGYGSRALFNDNRLRRYADN